MSTQTSKNGGQKNTPKKIGTDSEVTRVVLIFLLLLVIIALLVAAFMSLGNGADSSANNSKIVIDMGNDSDTSAPPAETTSPNHGNTETEPIPDSVLNPEEATEVMQQPTMGEEETAPVVMTESPAAVTTTGTRPANTSPVYISTTEIATLAPPLTTAYDPSRATTMTTTVASPDVIDVTPVTENNNTAGDGTIVNTNYTVSLSGSAGIYSSPNGGSAGSVGQNGTYTIVQEMTDSNGVKWGKLKSGAGWVRLN